MKTLYLLAVLLNGETIYTDDRHFTFDECRYKRGDEIAFYQIHKGQPVHVLCVPVEVLQ